MVVEYFTSTVMLEMLAHLISMCISSYVLWLCTFIEIISSVFGVGKYTFCLTNLIL